MSHIRKTCYRLLDERFHEIERFRYRTDAEAAKRALMYRSMNRGKYYVERCEYLVSKKS